MVLIAWSKLVIFLECIIEKCVKFVDKRSICATSPSLDWLWW